VPRGPYDTPEAIARALEAMATDLYDLQDALGALGKAVDSQTTTDGAIRARIQLAGGGVQIAGVLPGSAAVVGTDMVITWSPLLVGEYVVRAWSVAPAVYNLYWLLSHSSARTVLRATDLSGATVNLALGTHAVALDAHVLA